MKTRKLRSLTLHLANQHLFNCPFEVAWGYRKHDSDKVEGFERHRQGPAGGWAPAGSPVPAQFPGPSKHPGPSNAGRAALATRAERKKHAKQRGRALTSAQGPLSNPGLAVWAAPRIQQGAGGIPAPSDAAGRNQAPRAPPATSPELQRRDHASGRLPTRGAGSGPAAGAQQGQGPGVGAEATTKQEPSKRRDRQHSMITIHAQIRLY